MKHFGMLTELPKCDRDTKWANATEKVAVTDLLDTGLSQTFNLYKAQFIHKVK